MVTICARHPSARHSGRHQLRLVVGVSSLVFAGGCGPDVSSTSNSGSGTDSSGSTEMTAVSETGPDPTTASTTGAPTTGTGGEPSCADEADLVVGSACYRELELDDVRRWEPGESAAVRLTGSAVAEVVIRSNEPEFVVVSLGDGEPKIAAEFEYPSGDLSYASIWPPIAIDLDDDGLEEAVFPTLYGEVHVLSYDPGTGGYALSSHPELLPDSAFYLLGALDADLDGSKELVASTGKIFESDDTHMTLFDQVAGNWAQVGTSLHVPEIAGGVIVTKPLAADSSKVPRIGYIHVNDDWRGTGVTIVRVNEGFELVKEVAFESEYTVLDFASGDFNGNGFSDIYIGGYDPSRQRQRNEVYLFDGTEWSGPETYELGKSELTRAGDVTGDGVADLLTVTHPTRALDVVGDRKFDLVGAKWPLALEDLNGDGLADVTYGPSSELDFSNEPTVLRFLVSFD